MTANARQFMDRVLAAVRETDDHGLLTDRRADGLTGISGLKTVGVLQRLARLFADDPSACYVEIGVFQGLTLISTALEAPALPCFGIDNFATLDPDGVNLSVVNERLARFGTANARLLNMDFEEALGGLDGHLSGRRVGLYFVDGPHDYRSQMVCLLLAKRHLHDHAVIVVDDANYPAVRHATRDFLLGHAGFKLAFEAYSPAHPANLSRDDLLRWEAGWLNGVHVLVTDPEGLLPDMLPPVDDDRTLYFNEWLVHRQQMAELAPEAVALARALCLDDEPEAADRRADLMRRFDQMKTRFSGRFPDRNTKSAGLPEARFNALPEG